MTAKADDPGRKWTVKDLADRLQEIIDSGQGDYEVCISFDYQDIVPEQYWRQLGRYDWEPYDVNLSDEGDYFITIQSRQQP